MSTPKSIRLPGPLQERIEQMADEQKRTFSNMAVFLLERGLELDAAPSRPIAVSHSPLKSRDDEVKTDFKR